MTDQPDTALCPYCPHPAHKPGVECEGGVDHGPKHWHRCLCLNLVGSEAPCHPLMDCQGGKLGYSDIWYLQRGHTLSSADGPVTPDVLKTTPAAPAVPPSAESVPSRRAGLRDELAAAIWERQNPGRRYADCEHARDRADEEADADAVLAVLYREWPWLRAEAEDAVPQDRAAALDEAADTPAAECGAQNRNYESGPRLCIRAAQHTGKDHVDERGFHWSDTTAVYPVSDGTFRRGVDVRASLRRLAAETTPEPATEAEAGACGHRSSEGHPCTQPSGHYGYHRNVRNDGDEWTSWVGDAPVVEEAECCGAEPPEGWPGDCWCTLAQGHDGAHRCESCSNRHDAPGWTDSEPEGPAVVEAQPDETQETRPPVAYSNGYGSTYCLGCAPAVEADVPLTAADVDHWELCPSCGRHIVDVARAKASS
ncbi:hypothetical protein ABZT06_08605 [Streptomyces sp. NPDC005483]|uniref:hypothetical protein n=1 Tax=Streptomyces sp. NPDC005483 TaxID=3154882 RepID=UPI0033BEA5A3